MLLGGSRIAPAAFVVIYQSEALLNEPWHVVVSTPGRAVELVGLQVCRSGINGLYAALAVLLAVSEFWC